MKKEDVARGLGIRCKTDLATHGGNKVLPVSEAVELPSSTSNVQCGTIIDQIQKRIKGDKIKAISRVKELLRWAATPKFDKGGNFLGRKVLLFRNKGAVKAVTDDDQVSCESPKISLRWDVETCSTSSSAYTGMSKFNKNNVISMTSTPIHDSTRGNWITTDSEFVVLEL